MDDDEHSEKQTKNRKKTKSRNVGFSSLNPLLVSICMCIVWLNQIECCLLKNLIQKEKTKHILVKIVYHWFFLYFSDISGSVVANNSILTDWLTWLTWLICLVVLVILVSLLLDRFFSSRYSACSLQLMVMVVVVWIAEFTKKRISIGLDSRMTTHHTPYTIHIMIIMVFSESVCVCFSCFSTTVDSG